MDKFSYKNTPLGKAFTKAQTPPSPPPPSQSLGVYSSNDDADVVTRRYKSSFIQSATGGKGYIQYDKSTNKIRFQLDIKTPEGNTSVNTGWVKPNAGKLPDALAATVGRAITKSGKEQKLTTEEEQEYKGAIGQLASDLINFEKSFIPPRQKPKAEA